MIRLTISIILTLAVWLFGVVSVYDTDYPDEPELVLPPGNAEKVGYSTETTCAAIYAHLSRRAVYIAPKPQTPITLASEPIVGASEWHSARVSWYGPGFYGRKTASGAILTQGMMNVAHKSLPFGTRIQFAYNGKTCIAVVNDRGPFVGGRVFDLGPGTAQALGFSGVGVVKYRIL